MASKAKVFLDTNVLLDHLLDRQPFAEAAHRLLGLAETKTIEAHVSSLSFSNLFYILRKLNGRDSALQHLTKLRTVVGVCAVGEAEVDAALSFRGADFEDDLQYFAAKAQTQIDAIITRDLRGYADKAVPVRTPDEFLIDFATADEGEAE